VEEIESFPEQNTHKPKASIFDVQQVLVGTWEKDPLVASSKKGVSPQRETQKVPNKKDSDHKTICRIQQRRMCSNSEHDYKMK